MLGVCLALIDDEEDKKDFERLVHKYEKKLLSVAKGILKDQGLAEVAVWDTFFSIAECFQKVHNLSLHKMEAYLIITIKNASYAIYNKEKRNNTNISFEDVINENVPTIDDLDKYDYIELKSAIDELESKYRYALTYMLIYGLSADETAKTMGISRRLVYKYIEIAKRKIIEKVSDNDI